MARSLSELSKMCYKDQAIFFMNGFWNNGIDPNEANQVWDWQKHFVELNKLQSQVGEEGNELDQFWSAKFLEDLKSTMTSTDRKEAFRKIDHDNNGKMSLIEFLIWKYNKDVAETENSPQGDNTAAIAAAQAKMDAVMAQLEECEQKLTAQNEALVKQDEAIRQNDEAIVKLKQKQDDLEAAQRDLQAAEAELQAAVDELKAQEEAIAKKIQELEEKGAGTGVSAMKAKNELAQLKGEDPLPLRRAKITQEAAVRRVQKEQQAVATAKEEVAKQEEAQQEVGRQLEAAKKELEAAKAALEQAYTELEGKMEEAKQELEIIKKAPGASYGNIWYMQRELFESDKRLPNSRQKWDHKKPFYYDPAE